ncbi:MAG: endopeptidase La [Spirochaetaceae bacterium]|jgi:ATP-dependent Lon protease|nr:endopeptidase La [Spirochaetaceae bacterium]
MNPPGVSKRQGVSKFFSALKGKSTQEQFPLLPLRELVLFPQTMIPMFVTYKAGIAAVDAALGRDLRLFAACLKPGDTGLSLEAGRNPSGELPIPDTHRVGTVVRIVQHLKLPDNTYRVVLQGEYRAAIAAAQNRYGCIVVTVNPLKSSGAADMSDPEIAALARTVQRSFGQYAEFSKKVSTETLTAVEKTDSPERLGNLICNSIVVKAERKAELLGIAGTVERLEKILETLELENEIFGIQKNISGKVKSRMEKNQREYILNEQLREINKELGKDNGEDEFADLEQAITVKNPPEEILLKAQKELQRLRKLQPFSPEAGVLRAYLEWIADLPWSETSLDSGDLAAAERILDEDHFDMRKAKERILEFIAVRELSARENGNSGIKGPILCFVGPPGTGKTSLGKSVARALGRRFVRISLGGVRDEAEIRGHRKTYVGALPGKIIQSMRKAETTNPVFLLDEIDKLSSDFRGDPASALLEVLDPEQNSNFTDHYMEAPYDLSGVLFIATANSLHTIPYPLLDRMEIIEIPGYGELEKLAIAEQFLIPKELRENGLGKAKINFKDEAILEIIRHWTMESGVRSLEREIARCVRRIARDAVQKDYGKNPRKPIESFKKQVRREDLEKLLGRRKYKNDVVYREARVGVSYGLAWTETGGTMLPVETISFGGTGDLIITGNLGDVMKESARIALSYLRSVGDRYAFTVEDIGKTDFHVHVPEGAIPKDGPSAGVTLAVSLLSTLCQVPPKPAVAMTGELTLTGRILPIGGLKEKLLAAIRNGMEEVLLPVDNREDWEELDTEIRSAMAVHFVESAEDAFGILFDGGILKKEKSPKKGKKANPEKIAKGVLQGSLKT